MHQHFKIFINIWPEDGLVRSKLVASIWNNKIKIKFCQVEYILYFILILYFI